MSTIVIIIILSICIFLAIRSLLKEKQKGGCHGSCGSCGGCDIRNNLEEAFQKEGK